MHRIGTAALMLASACTSTPHPSPAPEPREVRLVGESQREAMKRCTPLGIVEASYGAGEKTVADGPLDDNARRRLREDAASRGANVVLLTYRPRGSADDRVVRGEAFGCPSIRG